MAMYESKKEFYKRMKELEGVPSQEEQAQRVKESWIRHKYRTPGTYEKQGEDKTDGR